MSTYKREKGKEIHNHYKICDWPLPAINSKKTPQNCHYLNYLVFNLKTTQKNNEKVWENYYTFFSIVLFLNGVKKLWMNKLNICHLLQRGLKCIYNNVILLPSLLRVFSNSCTVIYNDVQFYTTPTGQTISLLYRYVVAVQYVFLLQGGWH